MSVKARKRIKHVREDDISNPSPSAGMCSTPKSSAVVVAESKERDSQEGRNTETNDGSNTNAFTEGESNVEETNSSKPDTIEPNGTGTDVKDGSEGAEVGSQGTRVLVEKTEEEKRRDEFSKKRLGEINVGADAILSCLEPQFAKEFYTAAKDYRCEDIGIYILGILNRLSKQADYYDIDFEPEWEVGDVGFTDKLHCQLTFLLCNPRQLAIYTIHLNLNYLHHTVKQQIAY